jgi:HD-like signal output (HDOD) protein
MPKPATDPSTDILALVQGTLELPTMPEVLTKLNETMARATTSAADVAKVVAADPAVATNLLRIANSPYYGLRVRVASVNLAISVMGFNTTKKAALRAAVLTVFGKQRERIQHFDPAAFWRHAVFVGVAARTLAQQSDVFADVHPEDVYIAGLLHDIGKLILMEKCTSRYLGILRKAVAENRAETDVEREDLGFTHADVGSMLAVKWALPEDLAIAIRFHHVPSKDPFHRSLSSLIHLADRLAWQGGMPSTVGTPTGRFDEGVFGAVGLQPAAVDALLPKVCDEFAASELPW